LTSTIKDKWITEFWYDGFQRLVEKKIPEADAIYTVYDNLGRVALTQDGKLRLDNKWMFTKYDQLGRAILTGVYSHGSSVSRATMQGLVEADTDFYETRTASNYETQQGYTNVAYPNITNCEIWTVTYYDDYNFDNTGGNDYSFASDTDFQNNTQFTRLIGKVTGTKTRILTNGAQSFMAVFPVEHEVRTQKELSIKDQVIHSKTLIATDKISLEGEVVLEGETILETKADATKTDFVQVNGSNGNGNNVKPGNIENLMNDGQKKPVVSKFHSAAIASVTWLQSAVFYDKYGRVIQSQANNSLGGVDTSNTEYDFPGKVLKTKTVHMTSIDTVIVKKHFDYDHTGRLTKTYQQNNSDSEVMLAQNKYSELGALIEKDLHSTDAEGMPV
ncbi:hypothetical protein L0152_30810, partial [bacterium]|nr:hypothetical protein [bacterium]